MIVLASAALKSFVLLLLALATLGLLRRQSAAARHWFLGMAMAAAVAMPVFEMIVPGGDASAAPSSMRAAPAALGFPSHRAAPASPPASRSALTPPIRLAVAGSWLLPVWLTGVGLTASLLILGLGRMRWLAARARRLDNPKWDAACESVARELGIERRVRLLQCDHPALLVTWGMRPPTVILPAGSEQWSAERIRIVLRHELAHVRRRDWIVQLAAGLACCLHWFNPLFWHACRRLRQESEQACDDIVLAAGTEAREYAAQLLDLARAFRSNRWTWSSAPAIARTSSLERRVSAMLNPDINRQPPTRRARAALACAVAIVVVPLAALTVVAQSATARVSGSLTDPSGAPLSDATIVLTDRATDVSRAVPSDQAGYFEFTGLTAGVYALETRAPGFATVHEMLTVEAGASIRRDVGMRLGTIQETITVAAARPEPSAAGPRRAAPVDLATILERFRGKRLQPPLKTKDVRPVYPAHLIAGGVEGRVLLKAQIDVDGRVRNAQIIETPHPDFSRAAVDAISGWQFEPTRLWGTPVEVAMTVTVSFTRD